MEKLPGNGKNFKLVLAFLSVLAISAGAGLGWGVAITTFRIDVTTNMDSIINLYEKKADKTFVDSQLELQEIRAQAYRDTMLVKIDGLNQRFDTIQKLLEKNLVIKE